MRCFRQQRDPPFDQPSAHHALVLLAKTRASWPSSLGKSGKCSWDSGATLVNFCGSPLQVINSLARTDSHHSSLRLRILFGNAEIAPQDPGQYFLIDLVDGRSNMMWTTPVLNSLSFLSLLNIILSTFYAHFNTSTFSKLA